MGARRQGDGVWRKHAPHGARTRTIRERPQHRSANERAFARRPRCRKWPVLQLPFLLLLLPASFSPLLSAARIPLLRAVEVTCALKTSEVLD